MVDSPQQVIWETWNRQSRDRVASKAELAQFALRLHAHPKQAIDEMVRRRLIVPLFRGFYYVRDPQEVMLGTPRHDALELFSLGARWANNLGGWYFALDTALHIQGLSQEFRKVEQVVSDTVQRSDPIEIEGRGFEILRWSAAPSTRESGIRLLRGMRVSEPARTLIDFLYHDYWATQRNEEGFGRWRDLRPKVDVASAGRHLLRFNDIRFREWARARLEA